MHSFRCNANNEGLDAFSGVADCHLGINRMTNTPGSWTEYVRAALTLQRLEIDHTRLTEVTQQFNLLASMAQTFLAETLPPDEEPAPIYRL